MQDWMWWIPSTVILVAGFAWDAWRREQIYRQIRRDTARIGVAERCPQCQHPGHPMICIVDRCGCDLMTDPDD